MADEKVCLNDTQMKNIIDAARADESEDKQRIKKACPKALKFVRGYRPKKKKPKDEDGSPAVEVAERVLSRKANSIISKILDLF